jgi:tetrahydromethanopterin S-methyltransferase subunit E
LGFIKKHYDVTVDWRSSAKILFSSAVAAALTYAVVAQLGFASWIRLVVGVVFFLAVFAAAALLTRTIDKSDINNLRAMTSNLGLVGKLLNSLLSLIEKLMTTMRL